MHTLATDDTKKVTLDVEGKTPEAILTELSSVAGKSEYVTLVYNFCSLTLL